jgi:hypothetical protein
MKVTTPNRGAGNYIEMDMYPGTGALACQGDRLWTILNTPPWTEVASLDVQGS